MEKTKSSIKRSILIGTILFILVFCIVLSMVQYDSSKLMLYAHYEEDMGRMLRNVAADIDVDDLAACIETGVESEKYFELQKLLDKTKERFEIHFVYIIIPLSTEPVDNVQNVIAGMTQYEYEFEADSLVRLNELTGDSYSPETAEKYLTAYQSGELSFFEEKSEWGFDYTGLLPLYDSKGDKVAALCVDVDIAEIHETLRNNVVEFVFLSILLGILFIFIFTFWTEKKVSEPLRSLAASVVEFADKCRKEKNPEALKMNVPAVNNQNEVGVLASAIADMGKTIREYVISITHTENELAHIIVEANKDSLTAVRSKKAFDEYTKDLQAKMDAGENLAFSLVMVKVNDLDRVNQTFGRDKGDIYIKKCCRVICEVFHHSPVFRVGGNDFAVILTGHDEKEKASLLKWIQNVFLEMNQDETLPEWERCAASIGSAEYRPKEDHSMEEILKRAVEEREKEQ